MREYECLYVVHPQVEETQLGELTERFNHVLTENHAEVLSCNPWGKRRLAYEINHVREGIYVQVRYNGEVGATTELDRALKFSDFVIRHIIVRAEDLDPTQTNTIPDELPDRSAEDYEDRRRPRRDDRPPQDGASASVAEEGEAESAIEDAESVEDETVAASDASDEAQQSEPTDEPVADVEEPPAPEPETEASDAAEQEQ